MEERDKEERGEAGKEHEEGRKKGGKGLGGEKKGKGKVIYDLEIIKNLP